MKDLAGNADLTKELLDKVSNHGLNLSGALEQAALESKQLLQYTARYSNERPDS